MDRYAKLVLTLIAGAVVGLPSSGLAQGAPADVEKSQDVAMSGLLDCLITSAWRLDDHTSDAATIAEAISHTCTDEVRRYQQAASLEWGSAATGPEGTAVILRTATLRSVLEERRRWRQDRPAN